jgi:rhodanese-related sulfurtransferase
MNNIYIHTIVFSFAITAVAALVGLATNGLRPDGIPVITDIPYEIFSKCKDSETISKEADIKKMTKEKTDHILYVDARPFDIYKQEHTAQSINIPYSVLSGACDKDIERLKNKISKNRYKSIIVYGGIGDISNPDDYVDLAKSLSVQLLEQKIENVTFIKGGINELKKNGIPTVKGKGK